MTECLRYNRSFTAGKPVTVMLPFNFTRNCITLAGSNVNPSGKFYEFKGIEENQDHKWVAVMIEAGETLSNEVVENTLQANHPYLYVPNESTEHWAMYVSGGFSIFTEGNEGGEKETEYYYGDGMPWNHWMFKGTYSPKIWNAEDPEIDKAYFINDEGELEKMVAGMITLPTSCYLLREVESLILYDSGSDSENNITAIETTAASNNTYDVTLAGRTLWKDGAWNTLCLPFDVALAGSPLDGADVRALSSASLSEGTLTLNFTPETGEGAVTELVAGTPYIIKWTKADGYDEASEDTRDLKNPVFSGVTIDKTERNFTSADGNVEFRGSYSPVAITANDKSTLFLGSGSTLYYPNSDMTINAFRAYFTVDLSGGTPVKSFVLNFGDDTETGIRLIDNGQWTIDRSAHGDASHLKNEAGVRYDLGGRKVHNGQLPRGVYIHNGKKVVIK